MKSWQFSVLLNYAGMLPFPYSNFRLSERRASKRENGNSSIPPYRFALFDEGPDPLVSILCLH